MTSDIIKNLQSEVEDLKRQLAEYKQANEKITRNEALFRNLMENSIDAVYLMNEEGKVIDVNSVACNILNFSYDELLTLSIDDIDPNFPSSEFRKFWENKPESESLLFETLHRRKDGVCIPVEVNGITFRLDNVKYVFGVARDLTEHKNARKKIMRLNENLERRVEKRTSELKSLNNELEAFAYTISHDLRAPLRAINGFTKILCDDYLCKLDEDGIKLCDIIRDNTKKMSGLIDDILSFSRLSRSEMILTRVDLNLVVDQVMQEIAASRPGNNIHFLIEKLPIVNSDYSMIRQVVTNLIDNSIKFSANSPEPLIKISCTEEKTEYTIHIQDNGAGFDMKYYHRLFGVFHRLHSEDEYPGTGVGLAIVQRMLQRLDGRIWAEAALNSGATFHFTVKKSEESYEQDLTTTN